MSNLLNKATAKAEQLLHKHNTTTGANTTSTATPHTTATGTHTGVHTGAHTGSTGGTYNNSTSTPSTNAGPHNSNLANKFDPRVDSDRDGHGPGHGFAGTSGTHVASTGAHTGTHTTGSHVGTTGAHTGAHTGAPHTTGGATYANENPRSTNHGPHSSNLLNKADPRIDSDADRSFTAPGGGDSVTHGAQGSYGTGTTGGLTGHSTAHTGTHTTGTTGGLTGHSTAHTGTHTTGTTAGYGTTTGVGSHTPGSGSASNAGPHDSNLLNKLDPRVDSNIDGSKTFGGNATHY